MLRSALESKGYEVLFCADGEAASEAARQHPDAIVVEITNAPLGYRTLDELRVNHLAAKAPVLVVARRKDVAQKSRSSYNVQRALTLPFDPDELLVAIREVLGKPPLHQELLPEATHDGVVGMAEYVLARYSRSALEQWVADLSSESPWKDREDLTYEEILDVTPLVVEALVAALHYRNPAKYFLEHPSAAEKPRKHGRIRRLQGLPLVSLIREYAILQDHIWATVWSKLPRSMATADVINLQRIIDGTLDYMIELAVSAYANEPLPEPRPPREEALGAVSSAMRERPL